MAAVGVCAFAASSGQTNACVAGPVTPQSYTWNFKQEADRIFADIQSDTEQAAEDSTTLQQVVRDPDVDWQVEGVPLNDIRDEVNDIGMKVCRLETIRRVLDPWQQKAVDGIAGSAAEIADNTEAAIDFGNTHPFELWAPTNAGYATNIANGIRLLDHSVRHAVEHPKEERSEVHAATPTS